MLAHALVFFAKSKLLFFKKAQEEVNREAPAVSNFLGCILNISFDITPRASCTERFQPFLLEVG